MLSDRIALNSPALIKKLVVIFLLLCEKSNCMLDEVEKFFFFFAIYFDMAHVVGV